MPAREPIKSVAFQLDDDGDVQFREVDGVLDIVLVEDDDEVIQSISLALLTHLKEDKLHPDIGLPVRTIIALGDESYTAGAIARAIAQDDRIASVDAVTVRFDDADRAERVAHATVDISLKDGRVIQGLEVSVGED